MFTCFEKKKKGSFIEEYTNKIDIIGLNQEGWEITSQLVFSHPYPTTKIMWMPDYNGTSPDLLATTGDYLRVWRLEEAGDNNVPKFSRLDNNKNSEFCAPLTSLDWNEVDTNMIGTSSIDSTCSIWDIQAEKSKTQLIAHDKEVYDIAFKPGTVNEFASVGADGSLRAFDLRSLDQSIILYESPKITPLLRLAWNKRDPNYIATMALDSSSVVVLDIRMLLPPVAELKGHGKPINAIAWSPRSSTHICTASEDGYAYIWDLASVPKPILEPAFSYNAEQEINMMQWSHAYPEWIALAYGNKLQLLHV